MDSPSKNRLDAFLRFVIDNDVSATELRQLVPALTGDPGRETEAKGSLLAASPPQAVGDTQLPQIQSGHDDKKLTVGMATYDDYDGVYFTLQAIRLYHPEILTDVEFVIIDNNPDGPCAQALNDLGNWVPNYRYVPKGEISGTAIRDWIFREARGQFVLCVDCHVLIANGALKRLIDYCQANPETNDLFQGPLIYDDLNGYSTHFEPQWREGMYGVWAADPRGAHPDAQPFEIPMQGLGLFACRRSAWPGFNPGFRGFGGEEGYIHEKFRRGGGRTLCLPFLRWLHRFNRPLGTVYPVRWEDRVRNYLIGFREIGWDTAPVMAHFKDLLGEPLWSLVVVRLREDAARGGGLAALLDPARTPTDASARGDLGFGRDR